MANRSNGTLPVNAVITPVPPKRAAIDLQMLGLFANAKNKKPTKQPPAQKTRKSFTFICTPDNGQNGPPQVVRPFTPEILLLEKHGMVQTIDFEDSSHDD